jgi:pimeloyl-ACP methyl ester carboxylesterase
MLRGFGLFHSHAFEDSNEGKRGRERSIALVKKDKLNYLTMFLPALFSFEAQVQYKKEIEQLIAEANKMSKESIIACIEGMKIRPLRTHVLSESKVPVLFIIGLQDIRFPVDRAWEMIRLPRHSQVLILRDVAHMGYIEAPEATLNAVRQFAESV